MNPAQAKDELARRLRGLLGVARQAHGTTQADLAGVLRCEPSKISRILSGSRGISPDEVMKLLDYLGAEAAIREEIENLSHVAARRRPKVAPGAQPEKFSRLLHREMSAEAFRSYNTELVPGLLQTERVARQVIEINPIHQPPDYDSLREARLAR